MTTPGDSATIRITRTNIAERLYRTTGQGIYDQSILAGQPTPLEHPVLNGQVMGQDGGLGIVYRGRVYWFWGDTGEPSSPLGNFACSGATSELPGKGGLDPSIGVDFTYFVDKTGFTRPMLNIPGKGLKWLNLPMTIPDSSGVERLLVVYMRVNGLEKTYERGLALFDDSALTFEKLLSFDLNAPITLDGNASAFQVMVDGVPYYYVAALDDQRSMFRIRAEWAHMTNPESYENFSCLVTGATRSSTPPNLDRDSTGLLKYGWKANTGSIDFPSQRELLKSGSLKPDEVWLQIQDVETGKPLKIHSGTVAWNGYRKRWIMLIQQDVGEVWFAEGDTPLGPWVYARKIVSHDKYTFYLPRYHPFFDQDGGRLIYFEGTYSNMFSGNPDKTPRYDYNQIMYRLALDDYRLTLPAPVYRVRNEQGREQFLMRDAVDSLNLWERIVDIPFFAIPPHQAAEAMVPVFSRRGKKTDKLLVNGRAKDGERPLCYALPPDSESMSALDPISGTWQCVARTSDGSEAHFELELSLAGNKVYGPGVTRGEYKHDRLELELHIEGYTAKGALREKKLAGDYIKDDRTEKGMWTGQRVRSAADKPVSTSVVFLYGYQDQKTGDWSYSVNPILDDQNLKRLPKPICRVWQNPSSLLLLDYKARPPAIAVHPIK